MKPLVALVLYAYNEERFICEAIESALAQAYSPLEIVLSDDGSADRTFEIMRERAASYRGPHKLLLNHNETNIGIGSQLNAAVAATQGDLILLANGDDVSLPQRVAKTVEVWEHSGRKATAITANLECIDEHAQPLGRVIDGQPRFRGLADAVRQRCGPVAAASLAISRTVFERFGELMPELMVEDGPIYMRALILGPALHVDECLVRYRIHSANISQAYAVGDYEAWVNRHQQKAVWQSREGAKAYVQMLLDLHSRTCNQTSATDVEESRWAAIEKLAEYDMMSAYYRRSNAVRPFARLRSVSRLVWLLVKLQIKRGCPVLQSRNDLWHYRRVVEAALKEPHRGSL